MSTTIIGPRRAIGWNQQFGYSSQFGMGQFLQGDGGVFPMPSIPIAQAFRYWFGCVKWRFQYNLTFATGGSPNFIFDSGEIAYGVGYDAARSVFIPRQFCSVYPFNYGVGIGDLFAAPTAQERYLYGGGMINPPPWSSDSFFQFFLAYGGIGCYFNGTDSSVNDYVNQISLMGSLIPVSPLGAAGDPSSPVLPGIVWDDATPGNVFIAFIANLTDLSLSTNKISGLFPTYSGINLMFDGIAIKLYKPTASAGVTGTCSLKTYDS